MSLFRSFAIIILYCVASKCAVNVDIHCYRK